MSRLYRVFLLGLLFVPLTACGLSGGPLEGRVLEAGTNKPIPGAIVVVRWTGSVFAFAESRSVCVHVESATTDDQGKYRIPSWMKVSTVGWVQDLRPDVTAYKTGYIRSPEYFKQQSYRKNIELLEVFKGTREERLEQLKRVSDATGCSEGADSKKNRLVLQKALYEEARNIAGTSQDKKVVEILLFGLESEQFGSMEALKRMDDRKRGTTQ